MKTLLLIDADASFQKKLKAVLDPDEVKLVVEQSGAGAVKSANDLAPDAVILNLELGDVNGFLVCSSLKKSPATRDIPVLITSSERTDEDFEQHRKLKFRADGYYRKPVSREDLVSMLVEFLGPESVRSDGANPLSSDFTEENIDRLLDTTFLDFSETGEEADDVEPAAAEESPVSEGSPVPDAPQPPDTGEDFLLSDDDIDLKEMREGTAARPAEPAQSETPPEDFSGVLDDAAPVPAGESGEKPVPDLPARQPESGAEQREDSVARRAQMTGDFSDIVEPLKQQAREQSVQIIALEKENAFLKNENRELLMNLTSVKADAEEKLAKEQEKNADLVRRVANLEEQLSDMVNQHTALSEQRDRLESEAESLRQERDRLENELTSTREEMARLSSNLNQQQAELDQVRQERDSVHQELESLRGELGRLNDEFAATRQEFEEKESMLMDTIENLTRASRELEDTNRDYRERIQRLSGLLKDAVSTVELPEE